MLWQELRRKSLHGFKFLRQRPIVYGNIDKHLQFFVADFYCAKLRLIVEVDGKIHEKQQEYDGYRTGILKEMGYTVIRIKNEELENTTAVLEKIGCYLK